MGERNNRLASQEGGEGGGTLQGGSPQATAPPPSESQAGLETTRLGEGVSLSGSSDPLLLLRYGEVKGRVPGTQGPFPSDLQNTHSPPQTSEQAAPDPPYWLSKEFLRNIGTVPFHVISILKFSRGHSRSGSTHGQLCVSAFQTTFIQEMSQATEYWMGDYFSLCVRACVRAGGFLYGHLYK